MNVCFNSSDPMAFNATLLYDDNTEEGHLWRRGVQSGPLPPCSASSTPPDSRCLICQDRIVFAVCRNVPRGVKMMMEAGVHQVKISESDCPKPPSDDSSQWQLLVFITIILLFLLFLLVGVLLFKYWKCCRKSKKQRGNTTIYNKTPSHMEQARDSDSDVEQKLANLQERCDSGPERNGKELTRKETTEGESLVRTDHTVKDIR